MVPVRQVGASVLILKEVQRVTIATRSAGEQAQPAEERVRMGGLTAWQRGWSPEVRRVIRIVACRAPQG
jgi:hypothetical protein